jgi:hypothetical protein
MGGRNWSAWRSYHFGYSHLVIEDASTLRVDFLSTNLGGAITDDVTLTKSHSCNFGELCVPTPTGIVTPSMDHRSVDAGKAVAATWRKRDTVANGGSGVRIPPAQRQALEDLYHATGGATTWIRNTNWLSTTDPCDEAAPWYGVSCTHVTERTLPTLWQSTPTGRVGVTAISLPSNNLTGQIPDSLGPGLATTLQYLELSTNRFEGTLPSSLLQGLPRLHTLYVEPATDELRYKLKGSLPTNMGAADGLPNLRYLGLQQNQLTGTLPPTFGELKCHSTRGAAGAISKPDPSADVSGGAQVGCLFWLLGNNFTGTIPGEWCHAIWNEFYLGDAGSQIDGCGRPCLETAYAHWPTCKKNGTSHACKRC